MSNQGPVTQYVNARENLSTHVLTSSGGHQQVQPNEAGTATARGSRGQDSDSTSTAEGPNAALNKPKQTRSKKKRVPLSKAQKKRLCELASEFPSLSHDKIAKMFFDEAGVAVERSTVSRAIGKSQEYLGRPLRSPASKRRGTARFPRVEEATYELVRHSAADAVLRRTLTDERLTSFAKFAAGIVGATDFRASPAWLDGMKRRAYLVDCPGKAESIEKAVGSLAGSGHFRTEASKALSKEAAQNSTAALYDIWQSVRPQEIEVMEDFDRLEDIYNLGATEFFCDARPEDVESARAPPPVVEVEGCRDGMGSRSIPDISSLMNPLIGPAACDGQGIATTSSFGVVDIADVHCLDSRSGCRDARCGDITGSDRGGNGSGVGGRGDCGIIPGDNFGEGSRLGHLLHTSGSTRTGASVDVGIDSISARAENASLEFGVRARGENHNIVRNNIVGHGGHDSETANLPGTSTVSGPSVITPAADPEHNDFEAQFFQGASGAEGSGYGFSFAAREGSPAGIPYSLLGRSVDEGMQKERPVPPHLDGLAQRKTVTALLCVNATGKQRLTPWIIGATSVSGPRDHHYRPFPGIPAHYLARETPWLTSKVVREWLLWFDSTILEPNRVVLVVTSLINSADAKALSLKHVVVVPVPMGTVSPDKEGRVRSGTDPGIRIPMEGVLLKVFRGQYRKLYLQSIMEHINSGVYIPALSMRQVADMVCKAWEKLPANAVKSAFRASSILPESIKTRFQKRGSSSIEGGWEAVGKRMAKDLGSLLQEYRHTVPSYRFASELGLGGCWERVSVETWAERWMCLPCEDQGVLHPGAQDADIVAAVVEANGDAPESGSGIANMGACSLGVDGVRQERIEMDQVQVSTPGDALVLMRKVADFCRRPEYNALHNEEVDYNAGAIVLALENAIREGSKEGRSDVGCRGDRQGNDVNADKQ